MSKTNKTIQYSLINVIKDNDDTVDGYWIQDKTGSLDEALLLAREIEQANGNKITVAVTEAINNTVPILGFWREIRKINYKN